MFGLDAATIARVMAVTQKSSDIVLSTCVGAAGVEKAYDALDAAVEIPGAEIRMVTLKIGGKNVVILGAAAPGTLAEIGL